MSYCKLSFFFFLIKKKKEKKSRDTQEWFGGANSFAQSHVQSFMLHIVYFYIC